jgi:hypothetical protein
MILADSCQSDAGDPAATAPFREFADAFAHKSRSIDSAFACDHQVCAAELFLQVRELGDEFESGREAGACERNEAECEAARRPGTGIGLRP